MKDLMEQQFKEKIYKIFKDISVLLKEMNGYVCHEWSILFRRK